MRILMLGNRYTFVNDMSDTLARLTGAEVVHHTRGGACLAEPCNPKTKLGAKTLAILENENWDYVVLQEMSNAPAVSKDKFLKNAEALCEKIRMNGAKPVFYATWAYEKGSKQMNQKMAQAYHKAAQQNHALVADVGLAFYEKSKTEQLYAEDRSHPNVAGSLLTAELLVETILFDISR